MLEFKHGSTGGLGFGWLRVRLQALWFSGLLGGTGDLVDL